MIYGLIILVLLVVCFITCFNQIKKKQVKIDEAKADIDVALEKRFDSLTKMFDLAKSYAKFEKDTLSDIVKYRSNMSIGEMNKADVQMTDITKNINVVAENYPQLQSNSQFVVLQKQIADVEEHLQAAKRLYNANVSSLNSYIQTFPGMLFAGIAGAKIQEYYKVEGKKKEDVNMGFDIKWKEI